MPLRLLDLPGEIRDQIFHELLSSANSRVPSGYDFVPDRYEYSLSILRVSQQIYRESKKAFEDNVFVKITTPWPEAMRHISSEGKVPIITSGPKADKFAAFHLWVYIDTLDIPDGLGGPNSVYSMLICMEDLNAFTQMWYFSNLNHQGLNQHLRLRLTIQDPYVPGRKIAKSLQQQLLLPFGKVKQLNRFAIQGANILPSVERNLEEARQIPDPSMEECLETCIRLKSDGNNHLKQGQFKLAIKAYTEAFGAIHITVEGRKRREHADGFYAREVLSGEHKGLSGDTARLVLRVKLVANIVQTYLKAREYEEAYFWGKRSILLYRASLTASNSQDLHESWDWVGQSLGYGFLAQSEMGKIFYRTALAAEEIGRRKETFGLVKAAAIYLPTDDTVQAYWRSLRGL